VGGRRRRGKKKGKGEEERKEIKNREDHYRANGLRSFRFVVEGGLPISLPTQEKGERERKGREKKRERW